MKRIPFLDMKSPYREMHDQLDAAYRRLMESGWYILGAEVDSSWLSGAVTDFSPRLFSVNLLLWPRIEWR